MSDRTRRFRPQFLVLIALGVVSTMAVSLWFHNAKLSRVGPLSYLRHPILRVKDFEVSGAVSAALAELSFSDDGQTLLAATIEDSEDLGTSLAPFVLEASGIRAIAFTDSKLKSGIVMPDEGLSGKDSLVIARSNASLMATSKQQTSMVTVGESLETRNAVAHIWTYVAADGDKADAVVPLWKKAFELEPTKAVQLDMSDDGNWFAIAAITETGSRIWIGDARSRGIQVSALGQFTHSLTVESPTTAITFAPDGETFATAHQNDTAYLWNRETGEKIRQLTYEPPSLPRDLRDGQIVFSEDSRLIAMADASATYLWQADTGKLLNTITLTDEAGNNIWGRARSLAISHNHQWIASDAGHTSKVYFWDAQSGELQRVLRAPSPDYLAFSPDDRQIAIGTEFQGITLWRLPEKLR